MNFDDLEVIEGQNNEEIIELSNKFNYAEKIAGTGAYEINLIDNTIWISKNHSDLYGIKNYQNKFIHFDVYSKYHVFQKLKAEENEGIIEATDFKNFAQMWFIDKFNVEDMPESFYHRYYIDGEEIIYFENKYSVIIKDGRPCKIVGSIKDITEERNKDIRINEAFEKLNSAEAILGSYSWEYNLEDETVWLSKNTPAVKTLGNDKSITIGFDVFMDTFVRNKADFIYEGNLIDTKEKFIDIYTLKNGEKSKTVEYQIVTNGEVSHIRAYIKGYLQSNKNRLLVTCIDISKDKKREQELENEKNKLNETTGKLLVAEDIALCGSWEYDVATRLVNLSKNSLKRMGRIVEEEYLEISLEEYIRSIEDIYTVTLSNGMVMKKEDFRREEAVLYVLGIDKKYIEDASGIKDRYSVEYKNNLKDIVVSNYAKPIVENGKLVKLIGATKEITLEKNREAELMIAKERAEEASASQSRFVANMSHEIRTPLNAILGYAEIMNDQNVDERMSAYLKSITSASNSLLSLVDDILDYSQVKAGKFTPTYIPSKIGDFCEELKVLFYHKAMQKNLDCQICYDTELPTFMLPIAAIRQVLIHLLGNASKFTNEGRITLKAVAVESNNDRYDIDFIVEDTGIGIPREKQKMIFKEFEQADISHEKTGTGLGLALSINFARLVGGSISVESVEGQGSSFTLSMKDIGLASDEVQVMHISKENEKLIDVNEFNLQTAFRNLKMEDGDLQVFKDDNYEDLMGFKIAFNPKKIKVYVEKLLIFAQDTNNKILEQIATKSKSYCETLDVSNIMESITLMIKFLDK